MKINDLILNMLKERFDDSDDLHVSSKIGIGVENDNYVISNGSSKYILRIYNKEHSIRGFRTVQSIEKELSFMDYARKNKIPVPKVISCLNGEKLQIIKTGSENIKFIIMEYVNASNFKKYSTSNVKAVGQVVDNLSAVSKFLELESSSLKNSILNRTDIVYKELLRKNKNSIDNRISRLHKELQEEGDSIMLNNLEKGVIHRDIKLDNILFNKKGNKVISLLDFDDYTYSFLIEEVVMVLMHNLQSIEKNIIRAGYYDVFIQEIKNKLVANDLKYLRYFLKVKLLYNLCRYTLANKLELVEEIFVDSNIKKNVLRVAEKRLTI